MGCSWVVWLGAFVPSVSKLRAQWGPVLHAVVLRKWYVLESEGCSSLSLSYLSSEMGMRNLCRKAGVMHTGSSAAGLYSKCSIKAWFCQRKLQAPQGQGTEGWLSESVNSPFLRIGGSYPAV